MSDELVGERGQALPPRNYVTGIDGLRAIAVLSVLAYHIDESWLPGGFIGVDLFFVISGFVVSMATSSVRVSGLGPLLLAFYRRRVVRILPAALLFIVLVQLLAALFVPVKDRLIVPDQTAAAATAGMSNIILWLKAGDYFSPAAVLNPFTHTWSLAVEEQFYLIFPFFALLIWLKPGQPGAAKWGRIAVFVLALASLACAAITTESASSFAFYMMPPRFWELAAGMLLFAAIGQRGGPDVARAPAPALSAGLSLIATAVLIASFLFVTPEHFPFPSAIPPVAAAVALIYIVSVAPASLLSRILSLPPLRYFGRVSYSLYLWHWGVIVMMLWTFGLDTLAQKLVAVLLSFGLAHLSYRLVERPVRNGAWLAKRSNGQVVLMGVCGIAIAGAAVAGLTLMRPAISQSVTGNLDIWLASTPGKGGRCGTVREKHGFPSGETRYEFAPVTCPAAASHLFVLGDSHAWAYQRMMGNIAGDTGIKSTVYMATGCALMAGKNLTSKADEAKCDRFVEAGLKAVSKHAKRGDVLFLPGLRTERYREYWEPGLRAPRPDRVYSATELDAEVARLKPLLDRGLRVIIEAPKPVYTFAPLRCSDWFNATNPHCRVATPTLAEQKQRRQHALNLELAMQQRDPRIEIWDPLPLLCQAKTCPATRDGMPIVSDGDHITGWANDYLTPAFERVLSARQ